MVKELLQSSCLPSDSGLPLPRDDDDADDDVALDNIASIGPMMTSRADVMQTGVVIGQAAEHVHLSVSVCVCVRAAQKYAASSGALCSQSEFWTDSRALFAFALEEEKSEGGEMEGWREERKEKRREIRKRRGKKIMDVGKLTRIQKKKPVFF